MSIWQYVNDIDTDKVDEFIKRSSEKTPELEFAKGPKMSGEEGKIGVYFRIKDEGEFYELVYLAPNL